MEITDYFKGTGIDGNSLTANLARATLAIQDSLRGEVGKAGQLLNNAYVSCAEGSREFKRELLAIPTRD